MKACDSALCVSCRPTVHVFRSSHVHPKAKTSNCPILDGVGKNTCGPNMRYASAVASALQHRLIQDSQAVADLESFAVLIHG